MEKILDGTIVKGDVIVIRYEGPRGGPGMREMLSPTSAIMGKGLGKDVALITDGRFSQDAHLVSPSSEVLSQVSNQRCPACLWKMVLNHFRQSLPATGGVFVRRTCFLQNLPGGRVNNLNNVPDNCLRLSGFWPVSPPFPS